MDSSSNRNGLSSGLESSKPLPLDLSHHFSEVTKHRTPSKIKEYYKFFQIPGIGNLAGGEKDSYPPRIRAVGADPFCLTP